ncbi:hypothetical protein F4819DRAFT_509610 [Hypoxylon fuscum]|nr:hypothetical protein F4819DRAFT_509610 [Hypoxylon fuscum]
MSAKDSCSEAPGFDQTPNEYTGIDSRVISSQVDFLPQLNDSQETKHDVVDQETMPKELAQCHQPIQSAKVNYFTLPVIETTEEIAANFQYQKPPPTRGIVPEHSYPPTNSSHMSTSKVQQDLQHGRNSDISEFNVHGRPAEPLLSLPSKGERGELASSLQTKNDQADLMINSHDAPRNAVHYAQVPSSNTSDTMSYGDTSGYPFPEEVQSPRHNRRKTQSPFSLLTKGTLPKSLSDTRQKALAQLSPHHRVSRADAFLSHPAKPRRQSMQMPRTPHKQPRTTNLSSKGIHVDEVEQTPRMSPQVEQKEKQGLMRPVRRSPLEDDVISTTRPCSQASNISKPRAPAKMKSRRGSPTREQNSLNLVNFAESWNTNFLYNQRLLDRWEQKISMLEKHIEARDSTIEQYQRDVESRDLVIDELTKVAEEQRAQSDKVQDQIATSSNTRNTLEDKLRACRGRLNDAIKEQQQLFMKCRERFQETTTVVKVESQLQRESIEKASTTLDLVRAEIKQEVAVVVEDANKRAEELSKAIDSLTEQLSQREKDLDHQRQHAESLREQLAESHKLNKQSLESVAAQNRELLGKLEQDRKALIEDVDEIRLLCNGIYEGTAEATTAAEWQQKIHEADLTIQGQVLQVQTLQDEVQQKKIRMDEQSEGNKLLKKELFDLQVSAAKDEATSDQKVKELTDQIKCLQTILSEKDTIISRANGDLGAAQEKLRVQACELQDKKEQIQHERQAHKIALELNEEQQNQAIFQAVDKETEKIREEHRIAEERLQEAITTRAQVEQELADSLQAAESSSNANIDEDLRQIRGELDTMIDSMSNLTANMEESEHEREVLQGSLEEWSRNRVEIDQMQQILGRLAKDQPNAIHMSDQLKELLEIQKKLSGTLEYHQARLTNAEAAGVSNQSRQNDEAATLSGNSSNLTIGLQNNVDLFPKALQGLKRKVMVQSPVTEDESASPLSVEQERDTRRHSAPLRGIMKVVTRSASRQLEATGSTVDADAQTQVSPQAPPKRKVAKRGSKSPLTTHSMYNRPVAGSILGATKGQEDASQATPLNEHQDEGAMNSNIYALGNPDSNASSLHEAIETDEVDEPPTKRQRTLTASQQENQDSYKAPKIKVVRSMSEYFPAQRSEDQEPTERMTIQPKLLLLPGAPERKSSALVTYGGQGAGGSRSDSQSSVASSHTVSSSQTIKASDSQN